MRHPATDAAPADDGEPQPVESESLADWRRRHGLTWRELADRIGAKSAGQAQAWATGQVRPSESRMAEIERATAGAVSIWSMHRVRLEWERQHKRPIEHVPASPVRLRRRRRCAAVA